MPVNKKGQGNIFPTKMLIELGHHNIVLTILSIWLRHTDLVFNILGTQRIDTLIYFEKKEEFEKKLDFGYLSWIHLWISINMLLPKSSPLFRFVIGRTFGLKGHFWKNVILTKFSEKYWIEGATSTNKSVVSKYVVPNVCRKYQAPVMWQKIQIYFEPLKVKQMQWSLKRYRGVILSAWGCEWYVWRSKILTIYRLLQSGDSLNNFFNLKKRTLPPGTSMKTDYYVRTIGVKFNT